MNRSESASKQELDFERIRTLYANFLKFGYGGVAAGGALLYFSAARYSTRALALYWALLVVLVNIPRIILSIQFARKIKAGLITKNNVKPWEHYLTVFSALAYLGFVSVIFLPYGDNVVIGTMICAFVFMILGTGGVLMMSTSLHSILVYMTMVTLAIVSRLLILEDSLFVIATVIVVIGYVQITRLIITQNRMLVENIALKIENSQLALIDPLTKLWNRRRLELYVDKLIPHSQRSGEPFCLILFDLDHFKQYNDIHGHSAGDELLIKVSNLLLTCSREQDLIVRYGGEEFLMVLPQTGISEAEMITERVRTNIKNSTDVTVSAGLAEYSDSISFEQLVSQSDNALYTAKHGGRDRYVLASHKDSDA